MCPHLSHGDQCPLVAILLLYVCTCYPLLCLLRPTSQHPVCFSFHPACIFLSLFVLLFVVSLSPSLLPSFLPVRCRQSCLFGARSSTSRSAPRRKSTRTTSCRLSYRRSASVLRSGLICGVGSTSVSNWTKWKLSRLLRNLTA